ncbi:MAG TPA: hypothetical protein VKZ97_10195 [Flavobacteriaceae bacterium]|nr:hypothetical protein [Flavobacteriaceae bacterium]
MKLLHRLGYYLGGFSIGLIALAFFLNGKKVSCDYGPEARVLKSINTKPLEFSDEVQLTMKTLTLDSTKVLSILRNGSVIFSESDTRKEPCGEYKIEHDLEDTTYYLNVQNCDSLVTALSLSKVKD